MYHHKNSKISLQLNSNEKLIILNSYRRKSENLVNIDESSSVVLSLEKYTDWSRVIPNDYRSGIRRFCQPDLTKFKFEN